MDPAGLRNELLAMASEDLRVRSELAADGTLFQGYHPSMRAVHERHGSRLAQILAECGWPHEGRVGAEGARAAWLIVQHAISQPALQRQALGLIRAAADRGDAPGWQAAMLEDRIRTLEGRSQRYATQFDWDSSGHLSPLPLEDPDGVDERRTALGMRPLAEEMEARRRAAERDGEQPPADWEARRRDRDAFLRQVGWRPGSS